MPRYLITGGSFRQPDDTIKGVGETIELGEDIARHHADKLERLPDASEAPTATDLPAAA